MDSEPAFEGALLLGNYFCLVYDEPYARESDPFLTSIERNFDTALLVSSQHTKRAVSKFLYQRRIHSLHTKHQSALSRAR
jgi:hypothetical protein